MVWNIAQRLDFTSCIRVCVCVCVCVCVVFSGLMFGGQSACVFWDSCTSFLRTEGRSGHCVDVRGLSWGLPGLPLDVQVLQTRQLTPGDVPTSPCSILQCMLVQLLYQVVKQRDLNGTTVEIQEDPGSQHIQYFFKHLKPCRCCSVFLTAVVLWLDHVRSLWMFGPRYLKYSTLQCCAVDCECQKWLCDGTWKQQLRGKSISDSCLIDFLLFFIVALFALEKNHSSILKNGKQNLKFTSKKQNRNIKPESSFLTLETLIRQIKFCFFSAFILWLKE